ncbi:Ribosomal_S11 domain-containing protein [Cephalotus follicularis]|uniref:Ribosomal_S11 domain-containing protein n=1 Tax=Cephalotus follicularis TaxID=3775 RepID=A0A1Q3C394_CEPFO|nr:Ribosomal_S11 domain-containing protein [Cephalotus follicularis]
MYSLSCVHKCRYSFSASSLLRFCRGLNQISQAPFKYLRPDISGSENVARGERAESMSQFSRNSGINLGLGAAKGNMSAPSAFNFKSSIHPTGQRNNETGISSRPMDFVRGIMVEDRASNFSRRNVEQNADFVHIKLMRNNTFVTVTDSKGNTKIQCSSGCLPELKGGQKVSRYAAEATAEHVGRLARSMGLKSIVMKVSGFTYFKKKRQAIMSFREGFTNSRSDQNPIVYIEDTTRRPHNGCRLPKKRRV